MIHLVPSHSLDGRFAAQDLPDALQLALLNSIVVPRVVSSSMTPTIQAGDELELGPPISLTVGAIIVFRNDTRLVCHRITAIDSQGTLSTRGDATQGASEVVQPGSVIGVVTGVVREGTHLSIGQSPTMSIPAAQPISISRRVRTVVAQSITRSVHVFARFSLFHHLLSNLLRWAATVDVLTPAPLQSLASQSEVASFPFRRSPQIAGPFAVSNRQKPSRYVIRLGPWQLAQYDPVTESLLLRHTLRDAGLESLIRQICNERRMSTE